MPDLIDRDDLEAWLETVQLTPDGGVDINDLEDKLLTMETISIVYCKDCLHRKWIRIMHRHECDIFDCVVRKWDYCSWAERKGKKHDTV